jgi:hypothetical protein
MEKSTRQVQHLTSLQLYCYFSTQLVVREFLEKNSTIDDEERRPQSTINTNRCSSLVLANHSNKTAVLTSPYFATIP